MNRFNIRFYGEAIVFYHSFAVETDDAAIEYTHSLMRSLGGRNLLITEASLFHHDSTRLIGHYSASPYLRITSINDNPSIFG